MRTILYLVVSNIMGWYVINEESGGSCFTIHSREGHSHTDVGRDLQGVEEQPGVQLGGVVGVDPIQEQQADHLQHSVLWYSTECLY